MLQIFCEAVFKLTGDADVVYDQIDLSFRAKDRLPGLVLPTVASIPSMTMVFAWMRAG